MDKKIILVGKGASGKNHLMERFENRGFRHLVSHTNRDIRPGEEDGKEYHFVDTNTFKRMIANDEFLEFQEFNDKYYGSTIEEWNKSDIVIMAPQGVENIKKLGLRDKCFIIYVDTPYNVRKQRLSDRGMVGDSVSKRLQTDEKEFENFNDFDLRIKNEDF